MVFDSGEKGSTHHANRNAARRRVSTLILCCCALAVNPAFAATSGKLQRAPSSSANQDLSNTRDVSTSSSEQPPQCEADLTSTQAKQSADSAVNPYNNNFRVVQDQSSACIRLFHVSQVSSSSRRTLLTSDHRHPAAPSFFGQHSGQARRSLSQVLGAYSPVPVSTIPASPGNLIPLPSGYTQTASPYASPGTSSPPLFLSSPQQPPLSPLSTLPPPPAQPFPTAAPTEGSTPVPTPITAPVLVFTPTGNAAAVATPTASPSPLLVTTPASPTATFTAASPVVTRGSTPLPTTAAAQIIIASPAISIFSSPAAVSGPSAITVTSPVPSPNPESPASGAVTSPTAVVAPTSPIVTTAGVAATSPATTPSQPSSSAADVPAPTLPAVPSLPALALPDIPLGNEPLVTCQASFVKIPADSLTTAEVTEVAASLSQAIAAYVGSNTTVTTAVVPINAVPFVAPSPSVTRRQLLQTGGNTQQATVVFTITFATAPSQSDAAVQAAVQAAVASAATLTPTTTVAAVTAGAYTVTVVFPPNNQVSTTTSQGTLAASNFLSALRGDVVTALPGLSSSFGSFSLTASQLNVALVTATASSSATPAASITAVIPTGSSLTAPEASPPTVPSPEVTPAATPDADVAAPAATAAATLSAGVPATPTEVNPQPASPAQIPATSASADTPAPTLAATAAATSAPGVGESPADTTLAASTSPGSSIAEIPDTASPASPPPPPPPPPPSTPGSSPAASEATPAATAAPITTATTAAGSLQLPATAAETPGEAVPAVTPVPDVLTYNLSVAFPPFAVPAAQQLASTLFNQSDKALPGVIAANGDVNITNVVYGYQPISTAPAPAPASQPAAAPAAAAAPEASTGAAIESFNGMDSVDTQTNSTPSGQLYAINMQYGVTGAVSNTSANLLVLALPAQPDMTPSATDFTVQLAQSSQLGTVSLLPNQVSGTDFLVQVNCPEGYTGPVTVTYASPAVPPVNYAIIRSLLIVKVTASTAG